MALLTKKEFAAQTGQTTSTLATYIFRKKVKANKNGMIDTTNDTNKAFIALHAWKKPEHMPQTIALPSGVPDLSRVDEESNEETPIEEGGATFLPGDGGAIMSIKKSEQLYKHNLAVKTGRAADLDRLKIEKLKGLVVPVAPMEVLVFQFKQYVLTQQKITYEKFLNEIAHKYSITPEDMAYYRGFFIKELNTAIAEATDAFVRNLDTTLNEFAVKKGAGERN